ncbi:MAG TPA: flagellar filament capping protein FliD, partial [Tepidisphaeraceae bacterium]|nr:flagellar filament capping protein FliD [Tepidisphaeraceae bacterium]
IGGGELNTPTKLEDLNGGAGVSRGSFRITDRRGNFQVIDITDAVTLNDVVDKINNSLDISVRASVDGNRLLLNDATGLSSGSIKVEDLQGGTSASELGIAKTATDGSIEGDKIRKITNETLLSTLNEGRGVHVNSNPLQPDIRITLSDGSTHDVSLAGAKTVGDIRMKIEQATGNDASLDINSAADGFKMGDWSVDWDDIITPPTDTFEVEALNGSTVLSDMRLTGNSNGSGTINGGATQSELNSTLLSSLKGGAGLTLGTIRITDRGSQSHDIDLSGARSVDDILSEINDAFNGRVVARLNGGGTGIELEDKTGSLNAIVVSDVSGTTAAQLGIAGTFQRSQGDVIKGDNLQKAWFNRSTLLKDLNAGKGIPEGKFTVRGSGGLATNVTIDETTRSVGDIIDKINLANIGVTASVNANGDGLLLTDTAGGGLKMQVSEFDGGTVAKSLNIVGQAETTTINGSWEKAVAVDADDTLEDVRKKINDLGWGVSASIINDGNGASPFRLSLTSTNSGRGARVAFDMGTTSLSVNTIAEAADAVVFVSSDGNAEPIMVTSNSNTVSGVVPGLTLQLNGVTDEAVTLNVARNVDNVVESAGKFVEGFNGLLDQLDEYTKFDTETNEKGVLLGDPSALAVQNELYSAINNVVTSTGKYRMASDVGLRIGDGGRLEFDEQKFKAAYADDPDAVINLFTKSVGSLDGESRLDTLNRGNGVGRATNPAQADFRVN